MEKEYNSKLTIFFLLFLTLVSPFGFFIYAFLKVVRESILAASIKSFEFISLSELLFSFYVSATSTLISITLGSVTSFYLISYSRTKLNYGILNIVLVLPHIAFAYIIYLFFSETGFLFRFLNIFGLDPGFSLVNDRWGIGIMLNYVLKEIPFIILYLIATNTRQMGNHIYAARDLGASPIQCFFQVYLPLNKIQVTSIAIVIFAFVLGNYEVPFLLGANSPQFLSVSALNNFQSIDIDQNNASYLKVIVIFGVSFLTSIVLRLCVKEKR